MLISESVLVVKSDRCREESPVKMLLHASRMQRSVAEGALLLLLHIICTVCYFIDIDSLLFVSDMLKNKVNSRRAYLKALLHI